MIEELAAQVLERLSDEPVPLRQLAEDTSIRIPRIGWANGNKGGRADGPLSVQGRRERLRVAVATLAHRGQARPTPRGWVKL